MRSDDLLFFDLDYCHRNYNKNILKYIIIKNQKEEANKLQGTCIHLGIL